MPLGGVAIVNRPLWKREAVMGAGIDLDLGIGAVFFHSLLYLLDDLRRRVNVGFRTAEIELRLGLLPGQMRTVGLVSGQMRSVDRCRRLDAPGKMRRRVNSITPAHAVAEGADNVGACGGLAVGVGEQSARILHDKGNVDRVHVSEHALALGRFRVWRYRPKLHDAGAV